MYSAANIDAELDAAAGQFIHSPKNVLIERETHSVWLSLIFKWYHKDFERAGLRPSPLSCARRNNSDAVPTSSASTGVGSGDSPASPNPVGCVSASAAGPQGDRASVLCRGGPKGSVLNFIKPYLSADDQAYLDRHEAQVRLRYFKYDWQLNSRD